MSYPGDRYGYVPPAQYPVGNNQVHPPPSAESVTRPSWNHEDGIAFFDDRITPGSPSPSPSFPASSGRPEAELFMTTGPAEQRQNPAMDGYRHQYTAPQSPSTPTPTHTSYNPQSFAPSPSTNLPYHVALPSQVQRYTSPTSSTYPVGPATNFAQQVYNPAAYANTNVAPALPQRQPSAAGYHNYNYGPSAAYAEPTSPVYGAPPYAPQYGAAYPGQNMPSYGTNGAGAVTFQSQTPYPTHSQIPVGPQSADPNSFISRTSRSNSQTSQVSSLGGSPGLQRHPTNAPLPSRPMDEVPEEARWSPMWEDAQNSLMQDIVSDLGSPDNSRRHQPVNGNISDDDLDLLRRSSEAAAATANTRPAYVGSNLGQIYETSTHGWDEAGEEEADADEDSDESDPEGAAGLLAMQEDMEDRRFGDLTMAAYMERPSSAAAPAPSPLPPPPEAQASSDSALDGVDLSLYGGGHAGTLGYGPDVTFASGESATYDAISRPMAPPRPSRGGDYPPYDVSVDYGGTGGLQAPQRHRLSFDEGDEAVSVPTRRSGGEFPYTVPPYTVPPYTEDYPDMFYHPGLSSRPLPALPPGSDSSSMPSAQSPHPGGYHHGYSLSADSRPPLDSQARALAQQQVERSISLSNHSTTPPVVAPARSRTDAAEERRRLMRQTMQQHGSVGTQYAVNLEDSEVDTPASLAAYDTITLPTGRKRKFSPSKLTSQDVQRCAEPWALGRIEAWVREMTEEEQYLTRTMVEEAILNLFCAKVPTMKVAEAEALSASVVLTMQKAQVLVKDEDEWIKFGPGQLSGVLWQLTGSGCYAPRLHEDEREVPRLDDNGLPLRCYSLHCGRTLKKVNLDQMTAEEEHTEQDWARFWNLGKEELDKRAKKEIERQNVQHELITGEEDYMAQLDVLRLLYRDQLRTVQPPVIALNRVERFIGDVFGKVDAVQQINKENLLSQLKYRQQEQGPFISGFSDIFREWIRKARPIYIDFCAKYPYAAYLIRKEAERNMLFRQYLDTVRDHPKCRRLEWTTFVRAPIARLQRYGLLLGTIHKNMVQDSEEKANLVLAIEEVKRATHDCDAKVAETTKKVELLELQSQLVLRPGFQSVLHLDHLGRQLLKQGDLQRQGSKGVRWVDTHALLFDHYFILAKEVNKSGRDKKYDVSKEVCVPSLALSPAAQDQRD